MVAPKRNVGREILDGLRQLERGEHARVTTAPSVASIRGGTGLSQPRFVVARNRGAADCQEADTSIEVCQSVQH